MLILAVFLRFLGLFIFSDMEHFKNVRMAKFTPPKHQKQIARCTFFI